MSHGIVMNMGWRYDLLVAFANIVIFRGGLRHLFERALALAELQKGESVLDVGCGTGTLTLAMKKRVGAEGRVAGVDPGVRQIAWARTKATRRSIAADFELGRIEQLPFADHSFDVVISTLTMHHLPDAIKTAGMVEVLRVLAPAGRAVVVDFKRPPKPGAGIGAGMLDIQDVPQLMRQAGFSRVETGEIELPRFPGVHGAGYAIGRR